MRKKIKIIIIVLILGVFGVLIFSMLSKVKEKSTIEARIKTIPTFTLKTLQEANFKKHHLKPGKTIVFLYFNSECDFCQYEAESISNHIDEFNEIQLVFISIEPIEKIKEFSEKYNLHKRYKHHCFYRMLMVVFSEQFNVTTIPYALAYDKHQNLIKVHIKGN